MAADNQLEILIKGILDTGQIQKAAKEAAKEVGKVGETTKKVAKEGKKELRAFSDSFVDSVPVIGRVSKSFTRVGIGLRMIRKAGHEFMVVPKMMIKGLGAMTDIVIQLRDNIGTAKWFEVPIEQGERLRTILDDVKSGVEALDLATDLKQIGFDTKGMEQFARTVNVLAAFTGKSKQALEQQFKSGTITDRQLAILGKTRTGLDAAMAQAQVRAGGRDLDLNERTIEMIKFLGVTKEFEQGLGDLGKRSPFDKLKKEAQTLFEKIATDLKPAILASAEALASIGLDGVRALSALASVASKAGTALQSMGVHLSALAKRAGEASKVLGIAKTILGQAGNILGSSRNIIEMGYGRKIALEKKAATNSLKIQQDLFQQTKRLFRESVDAQDRIEREASEKRAAARKRMRDLERKEALQETIGRMKQARTLLRNFDREALNTLSRSGVRGVGAVVGGLAQAVELAKVFGSTMGRDIDKWSSKAKTLFNFTLEAGRGGLAKLIEGEKQRTNILAAQITLDKEKKKNILIENQLLNQNKTIKQAEWLIGKSIGVLEKNRSATAQKAITDLEKLLSVMQQQGAEQSRLLKIQQQIAKIEKDRSDKQEEIKFRQEQLKLVDELRKRTEQNQRLEGIIVRDVGKTAATKAQQLKLEMANIMAQVEADARRIDIDREGANILAVRMERNLKIWDIKKGLLNTFTKEIEQRQRLAKLSETELKINREIADVTRSGQRTTASRQLSDLKAQLLGGQTSTPADAAFQDLQTKIKKDALEIAKLQKQIDAKPASAKVEERRKELTHRMMILKFDKDRLDLLDMIAKKEKFMASAGGQALVSMAQATSGAISQLFVDLFTKPQDAMGNFGQAILSALGDIALSFAAVFAAKGVGFAFVPGGQATAAGLLGAAAGLTVLGGILKGGAAIVGQNTSPTKSPGGSGGSGQRFVDGLPDRGREEGGATVINNFYNGVPWRGRRNPEQEYRDMTSWSQDMERATGRSLIPRRIR